MGSRRNEWVRIFDIPETSEHKKGFTIYKIISMLYPESCPDAVTKITVWKRYNEFKKLHRELKSKHHSLRLSDKFPPLPNHPYFKRFNKDVIRERKDAILNFLEHIGRIPALFTSQAFVKFFESSHTPNSLMNGSINAIRADLHLPSEPEYSTFLTLNSEDEHTLSDTDSVSTMSSLSPSVQAVDLLVDPSSKSTSSLTMLNKKISSESLMDPARNVSVDSGSIVSTPTPPLSPNSVDCTNQYIIDAAQYITRATELEIDKHYDEAFTAYKQGIDILLGSVKQDKDVDRREMVRFKIEKYLLRAEKIYNLYLSSEMKTIQELSKDEEISIPQKPITELYKFKAIRIIENGILVIHTETQELFFVKVIYKKATFSKEYLILPDNVPYMVRLYNYYNCENALFLILQYSCGKKLANYLKMLSNNHLSPSAMCSSHEGISDNESEGSYSDLLNEYAASKTREAKTKQCEDATETKILHENEKRDEEEAPEVKELDNILTKSQRLISSMESSLSKQLELSRENSETHENKIKVFTRKLSDKSINDEFEVLQQALKLEDVVKWSAQLLLALDKLHILGVICRDLNINNLLIDDNGDVVLTYMCSISEERLFKSNEDICLAPELYTYEPITVGVDWWCYGSILYELLVGIPLKCVHPEGIPSYTSLRVPKYVCPEGRSLLKQLLIFEPRRRLGCGANGSEEIKTHPFFNSVSWEQLASKYI